jgi:hypothetical protein
MNYLGGTKEVVAMLHQIEQKGNLVTLYPHLLLVKLDHYDKSLLSDICRIYPPLESVISNELHKPHFLVFNLDLKKILCIGLGRKFNLFVTNAKSNTKVPFYGFNGSGSNKEVNDFLKNDPSFKVHKIVTGLVRLGQALEDFTHLPSIDSDAAELLLQETIEQGEQSSVELDGICMTRSALQKIVNKYALNEKHIDSAMGEIRFFFPNAEAVEFNPEDW